MSLAQGRGWAQTPSSSALHQLWEAGPQPCWGTGQEMELSEVRGVSPALARECTSRALKEEVSDSLTLGEAAFKGAP